MPRLIRIAFTQDDIAAVQGFSCGDKPWEQYLADWIQGRLTGGDSVLESFDSGTKVWLYLTPDGDIVGYGSLGVTTWYYPNPAGGEQWTIGIIPAFAVNAPFHGKPLGPWQQRYSTEILADLIQAATDNYQAGFPPDPALGLFVDTRNERAIPRYKDLGFQNYAKPLKRPGYALQRMLLKLRSPTIQDSERSESVVAPTMPESPATTGEVGTRTFEEAAAAVLNALPTPEQQARKDAATARRAERKRRRQAESAEQHEQGER